MFMGYLRRQPLHALPHDGRELGGSGLPFKRAIRQSHGLVTFLASPSFPSLPSPACGGGQRGGRADRPPRDPAAAPGSDVPPRPAARLPPCRGRRTSAPPEWSSPPTPVAG